MAGKKLGVEVGIDLLVNPDKVKLDTASIQKKVKSGLNNALRGVQFKGDRVVFSPNIDLDKAAFGNLKRKLRQQSKDILQALNISAGAAGKTDDLAAAVGAKGVTPAARKYALGASEKDLRLLNDMARVTEGLTRRQRAYRDVVRETGDVYRKSLDPAATLGAAEINQLKKRAGVGRQLQTAQTEATKFTKDRDIFTSDNKLVRQQATELNALESTVVGLNKELSHLNKSFDQVGAQTRKLKQEAKDKAAAEKDDAAKRLHSQNLSHNLAKLELKAQEKATAESVKRAKELQRTQLGPARLAVARNQQIYGAQPTGISQAAAQLSAVSKQESYFKSRRDNLLKQGVSEASREVKGLDDLLGKLGNRKTELTQLQNGFKKIEADAKKARAEVKKSIAEARVAVDRARQVYQGQPTTAQQASDRLRTAGQLGTQLTKQRESLIAAGANKDAAAVKRLDSLLARLGARKTELRELEKGFKKIEKPVKEVANATKKLSDSTKPLNNQLGQSSLLIRQFFRYALGYGALYKMLAGVTALVGGILELNKALYSIKAITAATDVQMTKISASIKEVAVSTKFSTTEIAKAAQVLAQAGVDPDQINSVLNSVATFAAGTETSIAVAADLVSTMRNVFKELDDLTIANQLTKAINISKLTGEDLKTILGISAQVTKSFNITSEQYLAAVTTLRNAGLKASTVATGLRQGLLEIFSPDSRAIKDLEERYKDIGEAMTGKQISSKFFSFTQQANPLLAVLRELDRLGFTGAGRKTLARSLDVRAANAIKALITNIDELEKSETRLATGNSALEASQTQMDSLSNSIDNLGASMTVLASDITEGPIEALEDYVDAITDVIKALDKLHVQSLSRGGEGLLPSLQLGAAGGVAGAILGRTPIQKALLGAGGAAAGTAAGVGLTDADDAELVGNVADAALFASILIPLFNGLGKVARTGLKVMTRGKTIATVTTAVTSTTGFLAAFSSMFTKLARPFKAASAVLSKSGLKALPGLVAKLGVRMVPFIGWIWTAYEVITALFDLGDDGAEDLKKQKNQIEGLKRQIVRSRQESDKIEKELNLYRFTDLSQGYKAPKSSAAGQIERLQEAADDYGFAFDNFFGQLTADKRKQAEEVFRQLRTVGSQEGTEARTDLIKKLEGIVGKTIESSDDIFLGVVNRYNEVGNAVAGQAEDFIGQRDRLLNKDLAELSSSEQALLEAYRRVAGGDVQFLTALSSGGAGMAPEDLIGKIREVYELYYSLGTKFNDLTGAHQKTLEDVNATVAASFENLRSDATATPEDLQNTVNTLISFSTDAGKNVNQVLSLILTELEKYDSHLVARKAQLELDLRDIRNKSQGLVGGSGRKGRRDRSRLEDLQVEESGLQAELESTDTQLALRQSVSASVKGQQQRLAKTVIDANNDITDQLAAAIGEFAFTGPEMLVDVGSVVRQNKSLSSFLDNLLDVTLNQVLDKVAARKLATQYLNTTGQNGEIITSPQIDEFLKLFSDYNASKASVPGVTGRGGRGRPEAKRYLKNPAVQKRLAQLEVEIADAEKTHLDRLISATDPLNPIIEKRNLILQEINEELKVQRGNVERAKAHLAAQDPTSKKGQRAREFLNAAQVRLVNLEITQMKASADASKAVNKNSLKYKKQQLAYEKRELDARKKALEQQIKGAVGGTSAKVLADLQADRLGLARDQADVEKRLLSLQEGNEKVVEQISEARIRELEAAEASAKAQEQIAFSKEQLRFDTGQYTTRDEKTDSYLSASGKLQTREAVASNLAPQITNTQAQISELNRLLDEEVSLHGDNTDAAKDYRDELRNLDMSLGDLLGSYEKLTLQSTLAFQLSETGNLNNLRVKFQALNSDITNLADNIQNNLVGAIDSIGKTVTDIAIDGGDLGRALQQTFSDMFRQNATDYLSTFINSTMQSILPNFAPSSTPEEKNTQALDTNTLALKALAQVQREAYGIKGSGALPGPLGTGAGSGAGASDTGFFQTIKEAFTGGSEEQVKATEAASEKQSAENAAALVQEGSWFDNMIGLLGNVISSVMLSSGGSGGWMAAIGSIAASYFKDGTAGLNVKGFAEGTAGIITGPGTGTSDSIPGSVIDSAGRRVADIRVGNGESILTSKATSLLGEEAIHALNSGSLVARKPLKFASGTIIGKIKENVSSGNSPMTSLAENSAGLASQAAANSGPDQLNVTLVDDRKQVEAVLASSEGERAVMAHVRRNAKTVRSFVSR